MDVLYLIASTGFFFWAARNSVVWILFLQQYQFSLTRIRHVLFTLGLFRKKLFSPLSIVKFLLLCSYPIIIFFEQYASTYHGIITVLYVGSFVIVLNEIRGIASFHKSFQLKSYCLLILLVALVFTLSLFAPVDKFLWLMVIDRVLVFCLCVLALFWYIPEELFTDYHTSRARERILASHAKVILFIGNDQSIMQKNLLHTSLIPQHYVFRTPDLASKKEVFQAINRQELPEESYVLVHISDGGIDELQSILYSLPPAVIIFDEKSRYVKNAEDKKIFSQVMKEYAAKARIYVHEDWVEAGIIEKRVLKLCQIYGLNTYQKSESLKVGTISKHTQHFSMQSSRGMLNMTSYFLSSTIPVHTVLIADVLSTLGVSHSSIRQQLGTTLRSSPQHLIHQQFHILNNSQATNPLSIRYFTSYIDQYKKQILVIDSHRPGYLVTPEELEELGRMISRLFDIIFIIPSEYSDHIIAGIKTGEETSFFVSEPTHLISKHLTNVISRGNLVFFHGELSQQVMNEIVRKEERT